MSGLLGRPAWRDVEGRPSWRWATVVSPASPITVRLDGDDTAVVARAASSLVTPLATGDRVYVGIVDRQLTVLGRRGQPGTTDLTLLNGWTAFSSTWATPSYTVHAGGLVVIQGMLSGSAYTAPTVATLPAGLAPARRCVFPATLYTGSAYYLGARVDVSQAGDVVIANPTSGAISWVAINGIVYTAGQ